MKKDKIKKRFKTKYYTCASEKQTYLNPYNHYQKSAAFDVGAVILMSEFKKSLTYLINNKSKVCDHWEKYADKVMGSQTVLGIYLLMGYALENIINGILVKGGISKIDNVSGKIDKNVNHRLKLNGFDKIKFDLKSDSEKKLVSKLEYVLVNGKYPTSKIPDGKNRFMDISKLELDLNTRFKEWDTYKKIYRKLSRILEN